MNTHVKYICFKHKKIKSFLYTLSPDIKLALIASMPKAFSTHRLARERRQLKTHSPVQEAL